MKQRKKLRNNGTTNGGRAKAAITKQYFSTVQDRLRIKINLTTNLAAMLTGQGSTGRTSIALYYWTTQHASVDKATKQRTTC
jgi:hypothetical protein